LGVVLIATEQIAECEGHTEHHHEQREKSHQVPAAQHHVATLFVACSH
jgi:hypothetical protein